MMHNPTAEQEAIIAAAHGLKPTRKLFAISLAKIKHFWSNVSRGAPNECWEWLGTRVRGYGELSIDCVKYKAHRLAWMLNNGPVPDEMRIIHSCDNPGCCNPLHLRPGTQKDNAADRKARRRQPHGVKHHRAKLTEDDVKAIRADTRTQVEIAKDFGVTQSRISMIKSRRNWEHVQ